MGQLCVYVYTYIYTDDIVRFFRYPSRLLEWPVAGDIASCEQLHVQPPYRFRKGCEQDKKVSQGEVYEDTEARRLVYPTNCVVENMF